MAEIVIGCVTDSARAALAAALDTLLADAASAKEASGDPETLAGLDDAEAVVRRVRDAVAAAGACSQEAS